MDTIQIKFAIRSLFPANILFKGCYYNRNIPFDLLKEKECFFIVNTVINTNDMGHWVLFGPLEIIQSVPNL